MSFPQASSQYFENTGLVNQSPHMDPYLTVLLYCFQVLFPKTFILKSQCFQLQILHSVTHLSSGQDQTRIACLPTSLFMKPEWHSKAFSSMGLSLFIPNTNYHLKAQNSKLQAHQAISFYSNTLIYSLTCRPLSKLDYSSLETVLPKITRSDIQEFEMLST